MNPRRTDVAEVLVIDTRGDSRDLERVDRALVARPSAASLALSSWAAELVDGKITIGGAEIDPVIARDLWERLGSLLGQADRDADHAEWARLRAELDRAFRRAPPARGRTLGRPSVDVAGVVLRERDDLASLRLATFAVATLRRTSRGWEGAVYALRPTLTGHERRPTGERVRVPLEAVPELAPAAPIALPGPTARTGVSRPSAPAPAPTVPAWLSGRWSQIQALHAEILAMAPSVGDVVDIDALGARLRLPREVLRGELETLCERGELAELRQPDAPAAWRRREPPPPGASIRSGRPAKKTKAKPKTAKKTKATRPRGKPPAVVERHLRCPPCGRVVAVPAGLAIPADPRCRVCGGPMHRDPA